VEQVLDILVFSVRDGFVQVSAFVALTVLVFSYLQYRSNGRIIRFLEEHQRLQPVAGGLLGLIPGCGGAIVAMPLYVRGSISFGTVVATLCATAGDSAFVILAIAPEAAIWAYGLAFTSGVLFGYMVDAWGLGVDRLDRAIKKVGGPSCQTSSVASREPSVPPGSIPDRPEPPSAPFSTADRADVSPMERVSHIAHVVWWIVAAFALYAGVQYLILGAPEVELVFGLSFAGIFTVAGLSGTILSFYLYFVGRRFIGQGEAERIREDFSSAYDTFLHTALETSMVTVWVIAAYLIYEYTMVASGLDIRTLSETAGLLAPLAGALLGLVPGCGPQIVFASIYAEGGLPFSALAANAISQDGDALFPLMAIDMKAAIIATVYTTVPAIVVSILLFYVWPFADYGFGVLR
jgi:hypothetical protein